MRWTALASVVVVVVLAFLPYIVYSGTTDTLVNLFILLTLASMWNLLAGYAGLVSVGQQAFVGLGAYFVLILALHGVSPFVALPVAAIGCGVARGADLVAGLAAAQRVLRDRHLGGRRPCQLIVSRSSTLGGGTGACRRLSGFDPTLLDGVHVLGRAGRRRPRAGRRVPHAARPARPGAHRRPRRRGGRAQPRRGSRARSGWSTSWPRPAAARPGALLAISQLIVQPASVFSVQWSAEMIFVTVIGGIGTIEGPIIGAIVFIVLQQTLSQYGAWYLIVLGLVAIARRALGAAGAVGAASPSA